MPSPKCRLREDKSILILLFLFIVHSRRCGGWAAGREPAGRSCDAVVGISRKGAWMAGVLPGHRCGRQTHCRRRLDCS